MPQPAIQRPFLTNRWALAATTATGTVTLPVRPGFRPYTEKTRGKRPVNLVFDRNIAAATAPGTAAALAIFGCEFAKDTTATTDANGRLIPGYDPETAPLALNASPSGAYRETILLTGGTGTGITPITITNPGSGYTSAPTIVVYWLKNDGTLQNSAPGGSTQATATALISTDGRVVGAVLTAIGVGYVTAPTASAGPPVIGFSGGGGTNAAATAGIGAVLTVNTHIPHAAHAPTTDGGAFWYVTVGGVTTRRVLPYHTGLVAPSFSVGLDPDQQVQAISTNYGFTEATGTHPDGTTAIGVLTLGAGMPNGSIVTVHRGLIRQMTNLSQGMGHEAFQAKTLDVMWVGCATTAGSTETSVYSASLEVIVN